MSVPSAPFAAVLRRFRDARRLSQLELALSCDVSARHISFLETGRAQPSRAMALRLAEALMLPLGTRNTLLQAAGFAPVFPASALDSDALGPFRTILAGMMAAHAPNPALLVDRHWNIRDANAPAQTLLAAMALRPEEMNAVRLLTQGPRAAAMIANLPEVIGEMTARLQLESLEAGDDPVLQALLLELRQAALRHPAIAASPRRPLVPLILIAAGQRLSFLSAIAHFGTSEDVTVRDLRLELLFPADEPTRQALTTL
jgi:transcriptional regulator with XRE-family HTH domain